MGKFFASLLVTYALLSAPALAATYVCTIKDVKQLDSNGLLAKTLVAEKAFEHYKSIIWDEESGLLRMRRSDKSEVFRREMKLLQQGTSQNSSIGLNIVHGTASTVVSTIHVQSWIPSTPFVFHEYEFFSGNCDRI